MNNKIASPITESIAWVKHWWWYFTYKPPKRGISGIIRFSFWASLSNPLDRPVEDCVTEQNQPWKKKVKEQIKKPLSDERLLYGNNQIN